MDKKKTLALNLHNEINSSSTSINRVRPLKIIAVGDKGVGKTSLLLAYTKREFPDEDLPKIFDNYADTITVDGVTHNVSLWDDAGLEDYTELKPLPYPNTDCFLVLFSVIQRSSFDSVLSKWAPEVKHHCPNAPVILVGTCTDLREPSNSDHVKTVEGTKLQKKIKAFTYIECSAKEVSTSLSDIFIEAVKASLRTHDKGKKGCDVL